MTTIVLAGGRSRRLGRNKALEQFSGKTLIQHVIDSASQLDDDIIEVHRKETGRELRCKPEELRAIVTDEKLSVELPQFVLDDAAGIADFIEARIVGKRSDETMLFVNGEPITLNRFAQDIVAGAVLGVVSTLKGVAEVRSIEVTFRSKVS